MICLRTNTHAHTYTHTHTHTHTHSLSSLSLSLSLTHTHTYTHIHTGKANRGLDGVDDFLSRHTCNRMCGMLRLPEVRSGKCSLLWVSFQICTALFTDDFLSRHTCNRMCGMLRLPEVRSNRERKRESLRARAGE